MIVPTQNAEASYVKFRGATIRTCLLIHKTDLLFLRTTDSCDLLRIQINTHASYLCKLEITSTKYSEQGIYLQDFYFYHKNGMALFPRRRYSLRTSVMNAWMNGRDGILGFRDLG